VRAGIAAVPASADGAVICLGDMPQVDADLINKLIAAFAPEQGALAVVPTIQGKRGNPVLWSRRFFPDLMALEGDIGARNLIGRYGEAVIEVPVTGYPGGVRRHQGRDRARVGLVQQVATPVGRLVKSLGRSSEAIKIRL
jgi:CTP:molybdopterin cytidylyltransferase MocA